MKAIRLNNIQNLQLVDIPKPLKKEGQVLLRLASVGICGSDIHYLVNGGTDSSTIESPLILGHEFSAYISEGVNNGKLAAIDPAISCGHCEFCREGSPNFCTELLFAGSPGMDGAMQEFLYWPENNVYPLTEGFTPEQGAMLEPLGVAIHALKLAKIKPGMDIGIIGAGPIGLLTLQLAKSIGVGRIFVTDKLNNRLEAAIKCGATDVYLADGTEISRVHSETNTRGLDVVFEAAGDDGTAVETAVQFAKFGAKIVLIGIPEKDETAFSASTARRKGLTIKVSRRMQHTYPTANRLVSEGLIDFEPLITHRYPLVSFQEAFDTAAARVGIKVMINMSDNA